MSEWSEPTWDDAIQRSYEALVGGEALYEDIDAEQGRSNIDIENHLRRAEHRTCPLHEDQHRLWSRPGRPSLVSIRDLGSQPRSDLPA